jgi:hypothetical protein
MAGSENKTKPTEVSVDDFIDSVPDPQRREDAKKIRAMMERLSGEPAVMWGPTIIGFGVYHYKYESGRKGSMARIGFAPRKEQVFYLLTDFRQHQPLMDRLGKHKTGKCCLYVKRLADVDETVLEALIVESLAYMREKYPDGA